tara:strand:- start:964 stop:1650 length:687 start_codon:yes stop_codon:yes gene_type:complete
LKRHLVPVSGSPYIIQRLLVFCGSCWLLASWIMVIGLRQPMLPTTQTWLPGVRMMLIMSAIGLVVVWPMAALSTSRDVPPRTTLRHTVILLITAQLITWPSGFVTTWLFSRTALIAITLTGWGLLAGVITAWGRSRARFWPRSISMLICLMLTIVSPILVLMDESIRSAIPFSPLTSLWYLAGGGLNDTTSREWIAGLAPWLIALASWPLISRAGGCPEQPKAGHWRT